MSTKKLKNPAVLSLPPIEEVYKFLKERSSETKANIIRKASNIQVSTSMERSSHLGLP